MTKQQNIIIEARSWIGTPFQHQAAIKNIGCDCIGLVLGVLKNIGTDFTNQCPNDYAQHPTNYNLKTKLDENLIKKPITEIESSDIFLMSFQALPQHVGFISEYENDLYIIHSYKNIGKAVEHKLNDYWKSRIIQIYTYKI